MFFLSQGTKLVEHLIHLTIVRSYLLDAFQCTPLHMLLEQTELATISILNNCLRLLWASHPTRKRASPDSSGFASNSVKKGMSSEKDIGINKLTRHTTDTEAFDKAQQICRWSHLV